MMTIESGVFLLPERMLGRKMQLFSRYNNACTQNASFVSDYGDQRRFFKPRPSPYHVVSRDRIQHQETSIISTAAPANSADLISKGQVDIAGASNVTDVVIDKKVDSSIPEIGSSEGTGEVAEVVRKSGKTKKKT